MDLKKINRRKSLKLLALLASSLLIATASAEIYRYMYIDGSITVGSAQMVWILGSDAPGDATIAGSTATVDLDVEQGTPINFTECLFLKNNGTGGALNYNVTISTAVSSSNFQEAKMHVFENATVPGTWTFNGTLDLTDSADFHASALGQSDYLRMTFEVNATIASGTEAFDIQVRY